MKQQLDLIEEIEGIKTRLMFIETALIENEEPEEGDRESVKEAMAEYKKRKTIRYRA
ncbi:MAG: hypothetical protein J4431_00685 [Candidatus Aenigmarchaeota archaeon]|nr:hypothetical protein [Candidatus Aenigmarchaeota archaeon]